MNRNDLTLLWNACLMDGEEKITACDKTCPWYRVRMTKNHQIDRRYADGGLRYRTEIRLVSAAVCFCQKEEDELLEELHRRTALLCDALPAEVGNETLLYCEMLGRPVVTGRVGGATIAETVLRLTLRKKGSAKGIVFFLGEGDGKVYPPEGFFSAALERAGKQMLSQYVDDALQRSRHQEILLL